MKRLALIILFLFTAGTLLGAPLKLVNVSAPKINCKFSTNCQTTGQDMTSDIGAPEIKAKGFLQSRALTVGQPGTAAAGLYGYLYRIDLTNLVAPGLKAKTCVATLSIEFGPVKSLDYDGDGSLDQVFVITSGGLGTVAPVSATQTGNVITFTFPSHPCTGTMSGKGESSFFVGLVSAQTSKTVAARLKTTADAVLSLNAYAPVPPPPVQPSWKK
ncbi:MAG: hypothetical protein EHM23_27870 [Acidobacteria bacterium]|nr:MAG: hypothetical protein EHM23_27870 [Acidobacteriota bacterium]